MIPEEIIVEDGSEGTEPEMTKIVSRRGEKNLVHGRANSLGDFWWEFVEPNHPFPDFSFLPVLSSRCLPPFILSTPSL